VRPAAMLIVISGMLFSFSLIANCQALALTSS
jgi:hypothetical protein